MKRWLSAAFVAAVLVVIATSPTAAYPAAHAGVWIGPEKPRPITKLKQTGLKCTSGNVTVQDGRVSTTGGCTFKGKPIGVWSWVNPQITDAAGTLCPVISPTSGKGKSFVPKPSGRVTPVFTLTVKKTRLHPGKVLKVGGQTVTAGWDSCGTPLEVISLPSDDPSPLCVFRGLPSFDPATRRLDLPPTVACPSSFGACRWEPRPEKFRYSPAIGVTIYASGAHCANGNWGIPMATLNSGCIWIHSTGAFVLPVFWGGGRSWWDVDVLTTGPDDQPLSTNIVEPGNPDWNGFSPFLPRVGPFDLKSEGLPICP